jgi:hypothetical protein
MIDQNNHPKSKTRNTSKPQRLLSPFIRKQRKMTTIPLPDQSRKHQATK